MSTISTIQNTIYQKIQTIQIITKEITNISTRVTCLLRKSAPMFSFPGMSSTGKTRPTGTLGRSGTMRPLGTSRVYGPSGA